MLKNVLSGAVIAASFFKSGFNNNITSQYEINCETVIKY